jgi:hypothetical protein
VDRYFVDCSCCEWAGVVADSAAAAADLGREHTIHSHAPLAAARDFGGIRIWTFTTIPDEPPPPAARSHSKRTDRS